MKMRFSIFIISCSLSSVIRSFHRSRGPFHKRKVCQTLQHLKDKSGVDKIIVMKQPYQLLNTNHEFFPSFDASNFHKLVINLRNLGQI